MAKEKKSVPTQEELAAEARLRFDVRLTNDQRVILHNAVVKLFNRKKPKHRRDSEWVMERAALKRLLMKLKRPDDPARVEYDKQIPPGFEL